MSIADVMKSERDGMMVEYLFPQGFSGSLQIPPYCAIPEISVLVDTPWALRSKHPLKIQPFPLARKNRQGFVQICPSLNYKFLWTDPENEDYRSDYIAFLKEYYGISSLPSDHHVDHLFNRARAQLLGLRFVRMVLLPGPVNTSHGAGNEKSRTRGIIGSKERQRSVDPILLMKLYGIRSPRKGKPLSAEMMTYADRIAGILNISPQEAQRDIRDMMDVANYRPQA